MASSKPRTNTLHGHLSAVLCVDFCRSKTGVEYIVTGGEDSNIIIWPQSSSERKKKLAGHTGAVTAVKCHGDWIISVSADKTLRVTWGWNTSIREPKSRFIKAHSGPVTCLDVHPTGTIVTGSHDKSAKLFDLSSLRFRRSFTNHCGIVTGVGFNQDGSLLVTVGADRKIVVHDLQAQTVLCDFLAPEKTHPTCVAFALNCDSFATGFSDGKVRLYDPADKDDALQTYRNIHSKTVTAVQFSTHEQGTFVSVSRDCTIAVVDALEGSPKAILDAGAPVNDLVISKTRENKLCVATDPKVELWEVNLKTAQKLGLNPVTARSFEGDELDVTVGQMEEVMGEGSGMESKSSRPPRRSNFAHRVANGETNGNGKCRGECVPREEFDRLKTKLKDVELEVESLKAKFALLEGYRY